MADRETATSLDNAMDVYVPGAWRCLRCDFQLSQATLFAQSGEIGCTADQVMRLTGERCPNDGSEMTRVTWRDRAEDNRKWGESLMNEIIAMVGAEHLPGALETIRGLLARVAALEDQLGVTRLCVTCGKSRDAAIPREQPEPACEGEYTPCCFDMTPLEAVNHWRTEAHRLREQVAALEAEREAAKGLQAEIDEARQKRPFPYLLIHSDPPFEVSGGRFASSQRMGWHLVTAEGFTVGVLCDRAAYDRLVITHDTVEVMARRVDRAQDRIADALTPAQVRERIEKARMHEIVPDVLALFPDQEEK